MPNMTFAKKAARAKAMVPEESRFRLKNEQGQYLHFSGESFTGQIANAWWGTSAQIAVMLKRPEHSKLRQVPYA